MLNVKSYLSKNAYPGRGILLGKTPDGNHGVIAYFIMGRSDNSRNRIFVPYEKGIRTQAYDPSKVRDPSLIIYAPVRVLKEHTIVTNGDQTDTIYECLLKEGTFEEALRTRTFEPDSPNWTPRISGILSMAGGDFSYKLSILKSDEGRETACQRFFFEYEKPLPGEGHILHTYREDGNPLPSFAGEPVLVSMEDDMERFTQKLWDGLDGENKVSLFVRYINLSTGISETRIVNKHK